MKLEVTLNWLRYVFGFAIFPEPDDDETADAIGFRVEQDEDEGEDDSE